MSQGCSTCVAWTSPTILSSTPTRCSPRMKSGPSSSPGTLANFALNVHLPHHLSAHLTGFSSIRKEWQRSSGSTWTPRAVALFVWRLKTTAKSWKSWRRTWLGRILSCGLEQSTPTTPSMRSLNRWYVCDIVVLCSVMWEASMLWLKQPFLSLHRCKELFERTQKGKASRVSRCYSWLLLNWPCGFSLCWLIHLVVA